MQKDLKIFEVLFSSFSSIYQPYVVYEGFRNTLTSQEKNSWGSWSNFNMAWHPRRRAVVEVEGARRRWRCHDWQRQTLENYRERHPTKCIQER